MKAVHRDSQLLQYVGGLKPFFKSTSNNESNNTSQPVLYRELFAAQQLLEEISNKEWTIAFDQKCSKILENALFFLSEGMSPKNNNRKETISDVDRSAQEGEMLTFVELFVQFYKRLIRKAYDLSTSQYSSHVLQTLLSLLPTVYSASTKDDTLRCQTEKLPRLYLDALREAPSSITSLISNPCASHVMRTFLISCLGYEQNLTADKIGHRDSKAKKNKQNEILPTKRIEVSDEYFSCFQEIYEDILICLTNDPLHLSLDPYAAPLLIILLKALRDSKAQDQLDQLVSTILPLSDQSQSTIYRQSIDETKLELISTQANKLAESPIGSNLIENLLQDLSQEQFHVLFTKWLIPNINNLSTGQYGNFIIQKILSSDLLNSFNFKIFLQNIDLQHCLINQQTGVIWKCAETCRRLQSNYKLYIRKLLEAFNLLDSQKRPLTWYCLLSMRSSDEQPFTHLLSKLSKKKKSLTNEEQDQLDMNDPTPEQESFEMTRFHPSGYSLLFCLMKFPTEEIPQLIATFKYFIKLCTLKLENNDNNKFFITVAKDRTGSHFLQSVVAPESPIPTSLINKLVKNFKGSFQNLSLHTTSGFVLTSFYKASPIELKTLIANELIEIKDELKTKNYPVYKICEINKYLEDKEKWSNEQTKKSKPREFFKHILSEKITPNTDKNYSNKNFKDRLTNWKNRVKRLQGDNSQLHDNLNVEKPQKNQAETENKPDDSLLDAVLLSIEGTAHPSGKTKSVRKRRKIEKEKINEVLLSK